DLLHAMQALSQLSYGPALLRAGNHSDIATRWEVAGQKFAARAHLPGQLQGRPRRVRRLNGSGAHPERFKPSVFGVRGAMNRCDSDIGALDASMPVCA
ncbi:hypothetical protein, partial [Xanthomonas citri]